MSLADTYAAGISTAQSQAPAGWTGPGGLMTASVNPDGSALIVVQGQHFTGIPGAALLSFATWVQATFG